MCAEIAQAALRRHLALQQIGGGARDDDLATVADREQSRNAIDRWEEVITVAFVGRPRVQRRTHAHAVNCGEVFGHKGALRSERGRHRVFGTPERGAKRVADRLEDVTAVRVDRRAHQRIVPAHRVLHRSAVTFSALRTALDVGEHEGDRPARKTSGRWYRCV